MKLIERIKRAVMGEKWLVYETLGHQYREMFRKPITSNEGLKRMWDKPMTVKISVKVALVNRVLVVNKGIPQWTAGVRIMGRKGVKETRLWLNQDRIDARSLLDKAFEDVGESSRQEYFYSKHASHTTVPLNEEELVDFCRYHRSQFDAKEVDGKLTLSARGSGTPVSAG